ncbi:MAG: sugar ABC transporter permease [OCS116 cluster bacterium]|uniref:ABC transporter permease n=1 Tax=OCS116 cluster bacterium TaxID=2030921 RepID=A0A2A4Z0M5_9PROT|nr:sugar ABC transporter permease [OCS116 cluster bacterium]
MSSWLQKHISKIVIAPSFAIILVFVYGFIGWTVYISFTKTKLLPKYTLIGTHQYEKLFSTPRWYVALENLFVFSGLFILIAIVIGLLLAILLDQKIRTEGFLRTIFLYPMAISFIVTGTAWKWILNPQNGIEAVVRSWGFESFRFDWLINSDMAIYTVVIAAVWQASGFVMALFLAGLRSVDQEIIKAAMVDGIPTSRIYSGIIIPSLAPIFLSAVIVLAHLSIKAFDLVVSLTGGGPGYSTDLPATFMYTMAFSRGNVGQAAASAVVMLTIVVAVIVPYLYSEMRSRHD